jgi:DNA repair exonuclease SbcCD ATPase subunit
MTSEITARNIGPVREFSIPLREGGGLTELVGINGAGKSSILAALQRAMGGNADVAKTDGSLRGALEVCGVKLMVTGSGARRSGELEAASIEGRFDISDIVDPGIKSPEAADLARAKAILEVTGKKPDLELFKASCGGASLIEAVATDPTRNAKSLVEMATHLKRDLEARRRIYQSRATALGGEAKALRESAAGVNIGVETGEVTLAAAQRDAIRSEAKLEEQAKAASDAAQRGQEAAGAMARASAEYTGPTVEQAQRTAEQMLEARDKAEDNVQDLERKLQDARNVLEQAEQTWNSAVDVCEVARSHEQTIRQAETALQSASAIQGPSDADLAAAAQAVQQANEAMMAGADARTARTALNDAAEKDAVVKEYLAKVEELTTFSRATFEEVLTQAVHVPGITFSEARMFWAPPGSGQPPELFERLGRGQQCKISADIAVQRIEELGLEGIALLILKQEHNEGLDPENRAALNAHLQSVGANMITARATDGPLRVEGSSPNGV